MNFSINTMKLYIVSGILTILNFFSVLAQTPSQIPKVMEPSPRAAELGRYGEVPVGTYSGTPNISIPLYTATSGDLTLPISASYNASGIKVTQEAGWIGLGWMLNGGGAITRVIRDKDDFGGDNSRGYPLAPPLPKISDEVVANYKNILYDIPKDSKILGPYPEKDARLMADYLKTSVELYVDIEPDIFFFNFPNHSGKFILDKSNYHFTNENYKPTLLKQDNIKIKVKRDNLDSSKYRFEITDAYGTKYYFGTRERSLSVGSTSGTPLTGVGKVDRVYWDDNFNISNIKNGDIPLRTSAWYLDSIRSVKGDLIKLHYDKVGFSKTNGTSHFLYERKLTEQSPEPIPGAGISRRTETGSVNEIINLSQIEFENGTIDFVAQGRKDILPYLTWDFDPGTDLGNPKKLTKMIVNSTVNEKVISEIEFSQSYFNETELSNGDDDDWALNARLKLDSITVKNGTVIQPPYEFKYRVGELPDKESYAMDHWGYYNGNIHNKTLIPSRTYDGEDTYVNRYRSEREARPSYMLRGILEEIKYPTGGTTTFTYGGHVTEIEFREVPVEFREIDLSFTDNESGRDKAIAFYIPNDSLKINWNTSLNFRLNQGEKCENINWYLSEPDFPAIPYGGIVSADKLGIYMGGNTDTNAIIEITNRSDLSRILDAFEYNEEIARQDFPTENEDMCGGRSGGGKVTFGEKGWYILYLNKDLNSRLNVNGQIKHPIRWETRETFRYGPGARVEKIVTNDGVNTETKSYQYEYTDEDGIRRSWARLMSPVKYDFQYPFSEQIEPLWVKVDIYSLGSASKSSLLTTMDGGYIGYDKVIERLGENGENGSNVYTYHNRPYKPSESVVNMDLLLDVPKCLSPLNGLLIEQIQKNTLGDMLTRRSYEYYYNEAVGQRDTYYTASDANALSIIANTDRSFTHYLATEGPEFSWTVTLRGYAFAKYDIKSPFVEKKSESLEVFYPNSEESVSSTTEYSYMSYLWADNGVAYLTGNHLPVMTTTTESNGVITTIINKYAASYNLHEIQDPYRDVLSEMRKPENNLIGSVIEQQVWKQHPEESAKLVAGKFMEFGTNFLPKKVSSLNLNQEVEGTPDQGPYEEIHADGITYQEDAIMAYDNSNGNIMNITIPDGVGTAYVWGYNKTLPVIQGENYHKERFEGDVYYPGFYATTEDPAVLPSGYSSLENLLLSLDDIGNDNVQRARWATYNQKLRNHRTNRKTMITTYTYDPLVGITSMTDPRGYTVYYTYDDFNRLEFVKDEEGNLVSENKYNYKN